jgi:hypothetical protein
MKPAGLLQDRTLWGFKSSNIGILTSKPTFGKYVHKGSKLIAFAALLGTTSVRTWLCA